MGGAASVQLHPPKIDDEYFKELLESSDARVKLFNDICDYQPDGSKKVTKTKNKINLLQLVSYFKDTSKALYPDFKVNVDTMQEAFKHSILLKTKKGMGKSKFNLNKHNIDTDHLTRKEFHVFIPTLFLFIKLWELFKMADVEVVEDMKVFKGEFMKVREDLLSINGVKFMQEMTAESWEAEFSLLDKNDDGHIIFSEFCTYAVQNLVKPTDYALEAQDDDDEEEESAVVELDGMDDIVAESCSTPTEPLTEAENRINEVENSTAPSETTAAETT